MALKEIMDSIRHRGDKLLLPVIDYRLIGHNTIATEIEQWVHPSAIGSVKDLCAREISFYLFTPLERYPKHLLSEDHAPRTHRIFDNGTSMHRRWQAYCIESGVMDPRLHYGYEIPLQMPELLLTGHCDGIVYPAAAKTNKVELRYSHGSPVWGKYGFEHDVIRKPWVPVGKPYMLEIKSIYEDAFNLLFEPLPAHQVQATAYMGILREQGKLREPEALFIYENKNNQKVKEIRFPFHPDLWSSIASVMLEVRRCQVAGILPARICASPQLKRAQKCDWSEDVCFATETLVQLTGHAKTTVQPPKTKKGRPATA